MLLQVRVLFTPQPPVRKSMADRDSSSPLRRRSRRSCPFVAEATDDSSVPYSQEESSSLHPQPMYDLSPGSVVSLSGGGGGRGGGCGNHQSGMMRISSLPVSLSSAQDFPRFLNSSAVDDGLDRKVRQDILNGLDYLERRKAELVTINGRLSVELDSMRQLNEQLRDELDETTTKLRRLDRENDDLKERLERSEKEKAQLGEQTKAEWSARVKAEEQFAELRRDGELEAKRLLDAIAEKEAELKLMESHIMNNNHHLLHRSSPVDMHREAVDSRERSLEALHKIVRLEDDVARLEADRERAATGAARLEQETAKWKGCFQEKCREFEVQVGRFQALKKSFNDLATENEKLKSQARLLHTRDIGSANQTWPATAAASSSSHIVDTVKVLDLPDTRMHALLGTSSLFSSAGATNALGLIPGSRATISREKVFGNRQRRKKSDTSLSNSNDTTLPPVSKSVK